MAAVHLRQHATQGVTAGNGGDVTTPLRSSLAGMRLGESRGASAFGLPSRAFSHADLHGLSGGYSDVNPFASTTDLPALVRFISKSLGLNTSCSVFR